jgi:WD40 repeat protein
MRVLERRGEGPPAARFSPDGTHLVTLSEQHVTAFLCDARTGLQCRELNGHEAALRRYVKFSPDGKRLLTASLDRTARLWDVGSGEQIAVFDGRKSGTDMLWARYSPDGSHVVTLHSDHTLRLWDAVRYNEVAVLKGHTQAVNDVTFSNDGARMASVAEDRRHACGIWP